MAAPHRLQKMPRPSGPACQSASPATGGACTQTDLTINGGTSTLAPGVYCKKLEINSGAVVILTAGIYVIRDGLLKVNSASTLKGDNVLLFFTGENAIMEADASSALALTGRTEGPYVDMVIYQNRNISTGEDAYPQCQFTIQGRGGDLYPQQRPEA